MNSAKDEGISTLFLMHNAKSNGSIRR